MARNKLLQVRVTAEEKADLEMRAAAANYKNISDFVRRSIGLPNQDVGLGGADRSEASSPKGPGSRGVDPPIRTSESSGPVAHISKTWTAEEMVDPDFEAQVEREMKKLRSQIPQSYRRRVEAERIVRERG